MGVLCMSCALPLLHEPSSRCSVAVMAVFKTRNVHNHTITQCYANMVCHIACCWQVLVQATERLAAKPACEARKVGQLYLENVALKDPDAALEVSQSVGESGQPRLLDRSSSSWPWFVQHAASHAEHNRLLFLPSRCRFLRTQEM